MNYPDLKDKTILVVEDEESNYLLLQAYIQFTKAKNIWAQSGEESVEICKSNTNIDLVLMDIRLPGIDGLEAARQIKSIRPELKIVAQTAFALATDRNKILNSACDDYISKPIKMAVIMDIFRKYILI
jgi:CheY-like chemotaxis protein